jgi:hypothetical protein
MANTSALSGLTPHEIEFEINRGGKLLVYQYCVSVIVITFRRTTPVQFVKAGESAAAKSLPWTLLSFLLGWWGIPWGFIYTPMVIYKNLNGGVDVTESVLARVRAAQAPAASQIRTAG